MKKTLLHKSRYGVGGTWLRFDEDNFESVDFLDHPLRTGLLNIPDVSESELVRHFTDLSNESHGADNGFYPLGSCTMKYNPKAHERYSKLDGFSAIHPCQPTEHIQGLLELLYTLQTYIAELTGMDYVSLQPAAGAHGEFAGLLIIRKFFEKQKEKRNIILTADSAHGTNPSTASMVGYDCLIIPTTAEGLLDIPLLKASMSSEVAGLMLTNPSTLGLFEENIEEVAAIVHEKGGLLYYDGANLNALMGLVRPGDMGFDVVHINTHKTLATPHGGGGPGAGPIGVKKFLESYLPVPTVSRSVDRLRYVLNTYGENAIGQIKQYMGHVSVLIKAYAYIRSMGPDGLRQASQDAVLNANYLQYHLSDFLPPVFNKICMHECLLSGDLLPVSSYSFAKRLIDHKIHPPTLVGAGCVYFPNAMRNAMLIEPTETESKSALDEMIDVFKRVYLESLSDGDYVNHAPHLGSIKKIPESTQPTI